MPGTHPEGDTFKRKEGDTKMTTETKETTKKKPRRGNLWVVWPRLALWLIEESPELTAGGLEGSLLFLGVAVVENGAAVLDQIGQNFLHGCFSERRRVVEFGD